MYDMYAYSNLCVRIVYTTRLFHMNEFSIGLITIDSFKVKINKSSRSMTNELLVSEIMAYPCLQPNFEGP